VARALRRPGLAAGLLALVGASTLVHWLAGRRVPGLWIMPDEAIYGERALRLWHHGSLPVFRGLGAGYGVLYPAIAGLPLAVGGVTRGYADLKLLQALVMSLAAVPVFAYGRRLMPRRDALVAAALTLASPLLLYSGLVMTEVLFYPLAAVTLVAIAVAVERATIRAQIVALALIGAATATRTQAVIFVAVLAAAALVDAALARDRTRLRAFWPAWAALLLAATAAVAAPGFLGSYSGTVGGGYPLGEALRFSYYHLAYLALMTAVLPIIAFALLLVEAIRGREHDRAARAFLSVTACAVLAVCLQVGFFAARFAPHLLGRDLASLPPILFVAFMLWLSRGPPRLRPLVVAACFAVLALIALVPWNTLVVTAAIPDSFDISLVYRLSVSVDAASLVTLAALALLIVFLVIPRRATLALPAIVIVVLAATSIAAAGLVVSRARVDQQVLLGSPRNWVDSVAHAPVTYLYDGEPEWNSVWQTRFWNERITHVLDLPPARVPGPMQQLERAPTADGRLAIVDDYVVATDRLEFFGTPVARHHRGADLSDLILWRLAKPARLSLATVGVKPNGDMLEPATISVYRCAGGRLDLTLLPKATDVVTISLDGKRVLRRRIAGLASWHGSVDVPASHRGTCRFTIRGGLLLGSTVRAFARP
jgi:Dolichyl-phosphate-mannose-protein mannosyltransferase